jgi:glycosyltransferase involved in cell wall biosynthesis
MKMELTIIIPVYNVEKYIEKCLNSIFNQVVDRDLYEIIIVNDGTPDNSMEIVHMFAAKYDNIKVINQVNQGLSVARNSGMSHAKGNYIWFIDSDDWIEHNSISEILRIISLSDCDVIATTLTRVIEKTGICCPERILREDILISGINYITCYSTGAVQRYIIKKQFLIDHNLSFFPNIIHEDADFALRMLYFAQQIYCKQKPVYNYLVRDCGSIMSSRNRKSMDDCIIIYNRLKLFEKRYVMKQDCRLFSPRVYKVLLFSISQNTSDTICFYRENKSYMKKQAKILLQVPNLKIKDYIMGIFCLISPLLFVKMKRKLMN